MLSILVTFCVLVIHSVRLVSDEHPSSRPNNLAAFAVFNDERFRLESEEQPMNMRLKFCVPDVLRPARSTEVRFVHPANI